MKRRVCFPKTKNLLYHPDLDRHGAVDVSGDLDVARAHGGRRNPGVESDSALRHLVLRGASFGDPEIRSSASGFGLPGLSFQPHLLRTLDVSTPFPRRSTTRPFPSHQPRQKLQDLSLNPHWLLSFIGSPLSILIFIIFGVKRTRRESCAP
jgi:hypothetical protein